MDHSLCMSVSEGVAYSHKRSDQIAQLYRAFGCRAALFVIVLDGLAQRLTLDKSHRVIGCPVLFALGHFVTGHDPGVLQLACDLGLDEESPSGFIISQ